MTLDKKSEHQLEKELINIHNLIDQLYENYKKMIEIIFNIIRWKVLY